MESSLTESSEPPQEQQPPLPPLPRSARAVLLAILSLAAALRLYGFGARPRFWEDELAFLEYALTGDPYGVAHEAPLYAWLQFCWMWWIQEPTANTMRLLSILLGVLGVASAFWLGRKIAGTRVGLLTAGLLAINPMSLYLSHEVRPYTLYILTSVLLIGCFLSAWERDRWRDWILYGFALIAALMSHLLVSQLCVALGVSALAALWIERTQSKRGRRFMRFSAISVGFGGVGISWLFFRARAPYVLSGVHTEGPIDFIYRSVLILGGGVPKLVWLPTLVALLALVGAWAMWRSRRIHAVLLGNIIVIGAFIMWATMAPVSSAKWLGWQRYFSHLLVPFLIFVAMGTTWLTDAAASRRAIPRVPGIRTGLPLLVMALIIPGSLSWLEHPDRHAGIANVAAYANFIVNQQHEVEGLLLFEELHRSERWLSYGAMRRRYALHYERHDRLPTYGISRRGLYEIGETMSRGDVLPIPVAVSLDASPVDGRYLIFPPTVGCAGLMKKPARGVAKSRRVRQFRWGLICDLVFEADAASGPLGSGRSTL